MKKFFKKINDYIKESYNELVHKVSWPTRQELSSSTIVVMTASLIMALVIFVIDFSFENAVDFFYKNIFNK
ncbi:MAG: preprotein translocase subunit SecE [Dysgonamonadaceae bacterium]|jgi:preprotein translocase subunit SecE|nr:preprotein translocase subunit SecE [Dysgonamonadaceae bacterium]